VQFFFPSLGRSQGVPVVDAPAGRVKGVRIPARSGRDIFAYYGNRRETEMTMTKAMNAGIPFAKPPVGHRRFLRPEPLDGPWKGVRDGSKAASACVQPTRIGYWKTVIGSEDCLYVNVYVPDVEGKVY